MSRLDRTVCVPSLRISEISSSGLAVNWVNHHATGRKGKHMPWARSRGVGHLSMIFQKTGIATLPAVLLRRVTATKTFHGSSATRSKK